MRCSVNRLLQLATKPRLQPMRSDTSSHVWPSARSKISRARRASSARCDRLLARRISSISSEFVKVIASLMDAIIVYKWLLQSTRNWLCIDLIARCGSCPDCSEEPKEKVAEVRRWEESWRIGKETRKQQPRNCGVAPPARNAAKVPVLVLDLPTPDPEPGYSKPRTGSQNQ